MKDIEDRLKKDIEELFKKDIKDCLKTITESRDLPEIDLQEIKLLTGKQVCELLEIGNDTLYLWIRTNQFPKPDIKKANRFSRWKLTTVKAWIDKEVNKTQGKQ